MPECREEPEYEPESEPGLGFCPVYLLPDKRGSGCPPRVSLTEGLAEGSKGFLELASEWPNLAEALSLGLVVCTLSARVLEAVPGILLCGVLSLVESEGREYRDASELVPSVSGFRVEELHSGFAVRAAAEAGALAVRALLSRRSGFLMESDNCPVGVRVEENLGVSLDPAGLLAGVSGRLVAVADPNRADCAGGAMRSVAGWALTVAALRAGAV